MTYYTPYPTERGWRFRCRMNAESEPFKSREACESAAKAEERRDRWIAKQPGLRGDIYRDAFEAIPNPAEA